MEGSTVVEDPQCLQQLGLELVTIGAAISVGQFNIRLGWLAERGNEKQTIIIVDDLVCN